MHISIDDRHAPKIARKRIPLADHKFCYVIFTTMMVSYHDNYQTYNHSIKLPDACFSVILFFAYLRLSGSVPRTRNNHTAHFRWCAGGHGAGM